MMTTCPECGSTEIIPDLIVFADESPSGQQPVYVQLREPEPPKHGFIWLPHTVATGFRAAICGNCGYTRFYTRYQKELLEAYKKGYRSETYNRTNLPPP